MIIINKKILLISFIAINIIHRKHKNIFPLYIQPSLLIILILLLFFFSFTIINYSMCIVE